MDYKIAIPSYKRTGILESRTMAFLKKCNVELNRIHIFVSNSIEGFDYRIAFPDCHIIIPEVDIETITEKFNYIHNFFPEGTKVVVFEDDIKELVSIDSKSVKPKSLYNLDFIYAGFDHCNNCRTKLWGIVPHNNGFYMKFNVTNTLKLIVAHCYGFISDHSDKLHVTQIGKSDYERTILYYLKFGSIVRFNYIGVHTTSYTLAGGMDREGRKEAENASCEYLVKRYPHFIKFNDKKESMYRELSFIRVKVDRMKWEVVQQLHDEKLGYV